MSQPAKVLLLYAHPESQDSVANRVLLKPATQLSNVTVHDLYAHYPDFFIAEFTIQVQQKKKYSSTRI